MRSVDRTLDRENPENMVSKDAQGEAGSLSRQDVHVTGNEIDDTRSETAHYRPKGTGFIQGEVREIKIITLRTE